MLFFCTIPETHLEALAEGHWQPEAAVRRYDTLAAAQQAGGAVLVLDAALAAAQGPGTAVPLGAVLNLDPYRPPEAVTAAGGYVMRQGPRGPELLLIYRRGLWDLPKGKRDDGETLAACALREVREEVGAQDLMLQGPLGTTLHGYPHKKRYAVKTTYWYLMHSAQQTFTPEAEEDIEEVAWVPWDVARGRVGYASLRDHMAQIEAQVMASII